MILIFLIIIFIFILILLYFTLNPYIIKNYIINTNTKNNELKTLKITLPTNIESDFASVNQFIDNLSVLYNYLNANKFKFLKVLRFPPTINFTILSEKKEIYIFIEYPGNLINFKNEIESIFKVGCYEEVTIEEVQSNYLDKYFINNNFNYKCVKASPLTYLPFSDHSKLNYNSSPYTTIYEFLNRLTGDDIAIVQFTIMPASNSYRKLIKTKKEVIANPEKSIKHINRYQRTPLAPVRVDQEKYQTYENKFISYLFDTQIKVASNSENGFSCVSASLSTWKHPDTTIKLVNYKRGILSILNRLLLGKNNLILSTRELSEIMHFPVKVPERIKQSGSKKLSAPNELIDRFNKLKDDFKVLIGIDPNGNQIVMGRNNMKRGVYIISVPRMGKTIIQKNMVFSLIDYGKDSIVIIEPHEGLYKAATYYAKANGKEDRLILIDPNNSEKFIAVNPLRLTETEIKFYEGRIDELLTRRVETFAEIVDNIFEWRKLATRAAPILNNILKVFIEANYHSNADLTLLEISDYIRKKRFREHVISLCPKEKQKSYIEDFNYIERQEPKNRRARIFAPLESKVDQLLSSEILKYMTCQRDNILDLPEFFDKGYYIFVNAQEGILGIEHVRFLATYMSSLVRQAVVLRGLDYKKDVFLFYDEFQKFCSKQVTEDFAEIRKYGLNPCVSHQHHSQLYRTDFRGHLLDSLLNNFDERIVGRLSNPEDASKMRDSMEAQHSQKKYKLHPKDITELEDYYFYYDSVEGRTPLDPVSVRIYPPLLKNVKNEIIKNPDKKRDIQKLSDEYVEFEKNIDLKEIVKNNPYLNKHGKTREEIKEEILERKKKYNLVLPERLAVKHDKEKKDELLEKYLEKEKNEIVKETVVVPTTSENILEEKEPKKEFDNKDILMLIYKCRFINFRQALEFFGNNINKSALYNRFSNLKKQLFVEVSNLPFEDQKIESKKGYGKNKAYFLTQNSLNEILSLLYKEIDRTKRRMINNKIINTYRKLKSLDKKEQFYGSVFHTFKTNDIMLELKKIDHSTMNFKLNNFEVEPRPKYAGFDGEGVVRKIKPDLIFEFSVYSKNVGWTSYHYILENDMGTETAKILKNKVERYKDFFESGAYRRYFPKYVRPAVLFLVKETDEPRVDIILNSIKEVLEDDIDYYDFFVTTYNYFKINPFDKWIKAGYELDKNKEIKLSNIAYCKRAIYHKSKTEEEWEDIECLGF